jgi:hypothetical protein
VVRAESAGSCTGDPQYVRRDGAADHCPRRSFTKRGLAAIDNLGGVLVNLITEYLVGSFGGLVVGSFVGARRLGRVKPS